MAIPGYFTGRVYRDVFDSGRGAFDITRKQIVTAINKIRDCQLSAEWKMNRGILGLGTLDFAFGLPGPSSLILPGINEYIATITWPDVPATLQETTAGPFTITSFNNKIGIKVDGGDMQTITLQLGTRTAEEVADDIADQLIGAVPWVQDNRVHLSSMTAGGLSSLQIIDITASARGTLGWAPSPAFAQGTVQEPWLIPVILIAQPSGPPAELPTNDWIKIGVDGGAAVIYKIPLPPRSTYGGVTGHWLYIDDSPGQPGLVTLLNNSPSDTPPGIGPIPGALAVSVNRKLWIESNSTGISSAIDIVFIPLTSGDISTVVPGVGGTFDPATFPSVMVDHNLPEVLGMPFDHYTEHVIYYGADGRGVEHPLSFFFFNGANGHHRDLGADAMWINVQGTVPNLLKALDGGFATPRSVSPTPIIASYDGVNTFTLTSFAGGVSPIYIDVTANGTFVLGGGLVGAGWRLKSKSQKDDDPTSNHNAHLFVNLLSRDDGQPGLRIRVYENGTLRYTFNPQYTPSKTPFYVWANPYGFAMRNDEPAHAGDIYEGNAFFHFTLTRVDPVQTAVIRNWFNMFGFAARQTLGVGNAFANVATLVDNGTEFTESTGFGQGGFAFCFHHTHGGPLFTRVGKTIMIDPKVLFRFDPSKTSCIQGWMWDCFIDTIVTPLDDLIVQENKTYIAYMAASGSDAPDGTLYLIWPRITRDTNVIPPAIPTLIKSGTVNVILDTVTLTDGDKFTSSMVGSKIVIQGVSYTVMTFLNETQVLLTTIAGNFVGVDYHT